MALAELPTRMVPNFSLALLAISAAGLAVLARAGHALDTAHCLRFWRDDYSNLYGASGRLVTEQRFATLRAVDPSCAGAAGDGAAVIVDWLRTH